MWWKDVSKQAFPLIFHPVSMRWQLGVLATVLKVHIPIPIQRFYLTREFIDICKVLSYLLHSYQKIWVLLFCFVFK